MLVQGGREMMRLAPEIPSAEDLVAGNTAEYLAALEKYGST